MKKIISVLLMALMLLSVIGIAFAEDAATSDAPITTDAEAVTEPSSDATSEPVAEPSADAVIAPSTDTTGADVEAVVTDGLTEEGGEVTDAGTTPDSPLWGVERALERISVALTFNKAKKAEKRLMHARERLLEVSAMARKGKLKAAARAAEANAEDVEAAEQDLAGEVEANGETDKVKTLEARLDRHIAVLEKVSAKLQEKGVSAPGIANALAIAKAKKNLVLAKQAFKEARKTGGDVEAAKAGLEEAKGEFKETRSQIRENKRFVKKAVEEAKEEVAQEEASASGETSTESSETTQTSGETASQESSGTTTGSA